jgi:hypothetical protein
MTIPEPLDKIHLTIRDREKIIFREDCLGITSVDVNGKFDVLPQHGNFISLISQYVRVYKLDGTSLAFPCTAGVLKVINNTIEVYFGILRNNPTKPLESPTKRNFLTSLPFLKGRKPPPDSKGKE